MNSRRSRWVSGIGAVLVGGGLVMASVGSWVTPAGAADVNIFTKILHTLEQILAKLNSGGQAGNHTLRWDTNNPSATRFTTAFPGAVLDNNTGLVWEQAPATTGGPNSNGTYPWAEATFYCANKTVGGTTGWRLPSVIELKSVQDPSLAAPFVPATVFTGVQSANYWSATAIADDPPSAWSVHFSGGGVVGGSKAVSFYAWCVRGGMNADQY